MVVIMDEPKSNPQRVKFYEICQLDTDTLDWEDDLHLMCTFYKLFSYHTYIYIEACILYVYIMRSDAIVSSLYEPGVILSSKCYFTHLVMVPVSVNSGRIRFKCGGSFPM